MHDHAQTREQLRDERFKLAEDVTETIRKASSESGVFEAHPDDFAELLDNAGVAHYDPEADTLRIHADSFSMALLYWSIDEATKSHRTSLDRPERQVA